MFRKLEFELGQSGSMQQERLCKTAMEQDPLRMKSRGPQDCLLVSRLSSVRFSAAVAAATRGTHDRTGSSDRPCGSPASGGSAASHRRLDLVPGLVAGAELTLRVDAKGA